MLVFFFFFFTEPQFKVTLEAPLTPQFTSDPTELRCKVTDLLYLQDGRLGVTWSFSDKTEGASQNALVIASLNEHGALITGSQYTERLERGDIAVTRRDPNIFILRMLQTRDTDMGYYLCTITAWTSSRQGAWEKAKNVQSTAAIVQWSPKGKGTTVFCFSKSFREHSDGPLGVPEPQFENSYTRVKRRLMRCIQAIHF